MPNEANADIITASELAVKAAEKELNRTLDYSMDSFKDLEALIQHVKNYFSNLKREGKLKKETVRRATVSIGGYLGEVIRRHHGGNWIAKNPVMKILVINEQEFSPILVLVKSILHKVKTWVT